jgi:hypothetical protein
VEGIGKMEEEERGVSVMELKQRSAIVLCCGLFQLKILLRQIGIVLWIRRHNIHTCVSGYFFCCPTGNIITFRVLSSRLNIRGFAFE